MSLYTLAVSCFRLANDPSYSQYHPHPSAHATLSPHHPSHSCPRYTPHTLSPPADTASAPPPSDRPEPWAKTPAPNPPTSPDTPPCSRETRATPAQSATAAGKPGTGKRP